MSKERLEAFSDAVIAIIMTLLAIELGAPHVSEDASFSQYAAAMSPLIPKIASFILSFMMIAIHWVSHHYFFQRIKRAPLGLVWLNMLFLLSISFMPFTTAFLGDHPTAQFPVLLYGVNQLAAALTFLSFRIYATKNKIFINKASAKVMGPSHSLPAIMIFSLSILLSFLNVYLSLACFLLVPALYFYPNLIEKRPPSNN